MAAEGRNREMSESSKNNGNTGGSKKNGFALFHVFNAVPSLYKGIFCIVMAAFWFSLMNLFVRLSGDVPSMQKSFFRNFVAFLFALVIMKRQHIGFSGKKENLPGLFFRSLFGTIGILCNFYAVDHMVLSDASLLNKMSPFFAILASMVLLKEKVKPVQLLIVICAFLGSLFIIKPTAAILESGASLIGLFGGLCAGLAYTYVRVLGLRGEKGPFIVCFFSAFSCLCVLPNLILNYHPMTMVQLLFLLAAGLAAAGGQFSITAAYCYAPAREISVYDYSQILFSALFGFWFLGQIPDVWSVVGYVIICSMAVAMFFYNNRKAAGDR